MSIGTYAQLQAAVSAWLLRASSDSVVTSAQVQNYIFLCEAELNRVLKVRELETDIALPTVTNQDYVTLPSDYGKISSLEYDDHAAEIDQMGSRQELKRKWGLTKQRPTDYAVFGTKIYLGATPDAVYPSHLYYFKKITALSDSAPTNAILTAFPDVYLSGAIRQGAMQIANKAKKDEAEGNYTAAIALIRQSDMDNRISSNARMKTRRRLM